MIKEIAVGVVACAILRMLARPGMPLRPDREGLRRLRPGLANWFVLLLGSGLTGAVAYVYFFIGSARADAEHQMLILPVLMIVFPLCTLSIADATFACRVRWKDDIVASNRRGVAMPTDRESPVRAASERWEARTLVVGRW